MFSNALHVQSKVLVNKETGLLDEKQVKIACQLADRQVPCIYHNFFFFTMLQLTPDVPRMHKFMPKARCDAVANNKNARNIEL